MKRTDFGFTVISHGNPNCETVKTLREAGYTGKIFIIIDDEDNKKDEYIKLYGDTLHKNY